MKKLYYEDIRLVSFEATVTGCTQISENHYEITLDQTAFFPEEGGQGADAGSLNDIPVLDVVIRGEEIYHITPSPLMPGDSITGKVDWDQRFDYMQQHSGEHIISGLVHAQFGYDNVGFHLGKEAVTLDFNGPLTLEQLRSIELEANRIIWQNLPVLITWPDTEKLRQLNYRSKLELTENVRIVTIPGVDCCACCAPHVSHTGEIGIIKITDVQSHRGGVRVNILCGERALQLFTGYQDSVRSISSQLSVKQEAIADGVKRLKEENLQQKERANHLQAELLSLQTAQLPAPEKQPHVLLFTGDLDTIAIRNTVNTLCGTYPGYCCLFSGNDISGYRYIIGSSTLDCRQAATHLREQLSAKGGGTAPMVQGSVNASEADITAGIQALFAR